MQYLAAHAAHAASSGAVGRLVERFWKFCRYCEKREERSEYNALVPLGGSEVVLLLDVSKSNSIWDVFSCTRKPQLTVVPTSIGFYVVMSFRSWRTQCFGAIYIFHIRDLKRKRGKKPAEECCKLSSFQFVYYLWWFPSCVTLWSWRWRRYGSPKRQVAFELHRLTTQKTHRFIVTASCPS
jgi:hypothetical protein